MAQPFLSGYLWGVADRADLDRRWSGKRDEARLKILINAVLILLDLDNTESGPIDAEQVFTLSIAWQELKGMIFPVTCGGMRVVYACVRKPELLPLITRAILTGGQTVALRAEPPMVTPTARKIGEYPNRELIQILSSAVNTTRSRQSSK
jgi:hypothetical protein